MEREICLKADPPARGEVPWVRGSPEALRKNKASYFFLICLGLWTIFCVVGTWVFISKQDFFIMERAIFLTYIYTFAFGFVIWAIPAGVLMILYLILWK